MSIETYTIVTSIISAFSVAWWIVSDLIDKRNSYWCAAEIERLSDKLEKLKHENLTYYRKFGIIEDSREQNDSF
jgi:hypothetical protein